MVRDFIKNIVNHIEYIKESKGIILHEKTIYEIDYYKEENSKEWYLDYSLYNSNQVFLASGSIEINYDEVKFLTLRISEILLNQNNKFINLFSNGEN